MQKAIDLSIFKDKNQEEIAIIHASLKVLCDQAFQNFSEAAPKKGIVSSNASFERRSRLQRRYDDLSKLVTAARKKLGLLCTDPCFNAREGKVGRDKTDCRYCVDCEMSMVTTERNRYARHNDVQGDSLQIKETVL